MMKTRSLILLVCSFLLSVSPLYAETGLFKTNNPDGVKYEFARSYIASMGYFESVEKRLRDSAEAGDALDESKRLKRNLDRLAKDNLDLRVAKNYMTKYFNAGNALMRKVVDSYALTCDELIALNHKERDLWNKWPEMKKVDDAGNVDLSEFLTEQEKLAVERKSIMQKLIETSVLMTKVLLSEDILEKQVRKRLALSGKQREQLVRNLDSYAGDNLDWGMKPGQTYLQGAQAIVREVLEDPTYLNVDE